MNPTASVAVTGASAGVGRAVAETFASHGFRVGLIARSRQSLEGVATKLAETGAHAIAAPADVADAAQVSAAADLIEQQLGPIDVWVNSAMVTIFGPLSEVAPEEFKRVTEVTYLGAVHGTMAALARMRKRNRGAIVQVGSALAYRAIPLQAAYCGAKHAIRGFTDAVRCELLHEGSGIKITSVHLPAVNTPQFDWALNKLPNKPQPVPPVYQPEVAARAVFKAAQEAPRELWVGRSTVMAIVGNKLMPGYLDRRMARNAWKGQMRPETEPGGRPANLFEPVEALHAMHGSFGRRARDSGWSL